MSSHSDDDLIFGKPLLFVGGVADGANMRTDGHSRVWRVPKRRTMRMDFAETAGLQDQMFECPYDEYRLERLAGEKEHFVVMLKSDLTADQLIAMLLANYQTPANEQPERCIRKINPNKILGVMWTCGDECNCRQPQIIEYRWKTKMWKNGPVNPDYYYHKMLDEGPFYSDPDESERAHQNAWLLSAASRANFNVQNLSELRKEFGP